MQFNILQGSNLSMVLIVPTEKDGLAGLEEKMASADLSAILNSAHKRRVRAFVPKFKIEYSQEIKDTLSKVGYS